MGKVKVIVSVAVLLIDAKLIIDLMGIGRVVFSNEKEYTFERSEIVGCGAIMRPGDWLLFIMNDGKRGAVRFNKITCFKAEYSLWAEENPKNLNQGKLYFLYKAPRYFDCWQSRTIFIPKKDTPLFRWSPPNLLRIDNDNIQKFTVYTEGLPIEPKIFLSPSLVWQQVDRLADY